MKRRIKIKAAVSAAVALLVISALFSSAFVGGTHLQDSELVKTFLTKKQRWAVKTGFDRAAAKIDTTDSGLSRATVTTVADLVLQTKPKPPKKSAKVPDPGSVRRLPVEATVYTIDADMIGYKLVSEDQDLHVVIRDHGSSADAPTMIVEIPDPTVVSKSSPWRQRMAIVRSKFFELYSPKVRFKKCNIHLAVTGVGFFDKKHGQIGVAANGVELHPVLAFSPL